MLNIETIQRLKGELSIPFEYRTPTTDFLRELSGDFLELQRWSTLAGVGLVRPTPDEDPLLPDAELVALSYRFGDTTVSLLIEAAFLKADYADEFPHTGARLEESMAKLRLFFNLPVTRDPLQHLMGDIGLLNHLTVGAVSVTATLALVIGTLDYAGLSARTTIMASRNASSIS